jgi:uncharacterized membrane protein YhaH (DUF805 family)
VGITGCLAVSFDPVTSPPTARATEEPVRVKESDHRTRILNASLTAVGVACTALIALTGIVFFVERLFANRRESPSPLPPPTDRRIVAVVVVAALVVAFVAAWSHVRRERETDFNPWWSLAPVVTLVLIALVFVVVSEGQERYYLSTASRDFPTASKAVLRADGHQACDWLRGRHWGPPPDIPMRRQNLFYRALSHGDYESPTPSTSDGALNKSSSRLLIFYTRYLRRQNGGTLAPAGKLKRQVAWLAWYDLCPAQRKLHKPAPSGD